MFFTRNKSFFCVRNLVLSLANLLLLGVHFYHRYYQFAGFHAYLHHPSNAITAIHIIQPAKIGWHYNLGKKAVLDKRYSPQHTYCLLFPSFSLTSFVDDPKHVPCAEQMYARPVFLRRSSRGPPVPLAV